MPSWNIHMAVADALLESDSDKIESSSAFIFGNFVPDIYVGYMVKNITKSYTYRKTHLADPDVVPTPDFELFWERYGKPGFLGKSRDVSLGAYTHLIADAVFNEATVEFLAKHGIPRGEEARRRKQKDFACWGKSLTLRHRPQLDTLTLSEAQAFSQYSIEPADARSAVVVAQGIFDKNCQSSKDICATDDVYCMLDQEFFDATFAECLCVCKEKLSQVTAN